MSLLLKIYNKISNDVVRRNLWQLSLSEIISRALNFVTVIFIARHYGVENFGLLGFVGAITFYFMYLINFGYDSYGTRETAKYDIKNASVIFNDILSIKLLSLVPSLGLLCLSGLIFFKNSNDFLFLLVYATTLIPFSVDSQWFFLGIQRTKTIPIIRLIESSFYFISVVIVYYFFSSALIWIPIILLLAKILSVTYAFNILQKLITIKLNFNWQRIKKTTSGSFAIGLSSVFALLYLNFDLILLGFFKSNYEVGIYNTAIKIYLILALPFQLIFSSFYPSLSRSYHDKSKNIYDVFPRYVKYQLTLGIVLMLFSLICSPLIINVFLGSKYSLSVLPIRILSLNIIIVGVSFAFGNPLIAWGKQKFHTISLGAGAVLNIILNLLFIPRYSYIGAAYSTVASEIIVSLLLFIFFKQNFGKKVLSKKWA